ncbi:TolC family protein [Achromobacter xylosoxidans]
MLRAAARLGMARSALYPRLSLGGSVLYAYNMTQNRRSNNNFVPVGGPTIDIPLWDWGARQAQVKAGEQGIAAALAGYRKAVLSGVSEVEESLSALARERERIAALDEARRCWTGATARSASWRRLACPAPTTGWRAGARCSRRSPTWRWRAARGPWPSSRSTRRWAAPRWRRSLSRNSRRNSRRKSRRKSRRNNPGRCVHDRPGAQDTGLRMAALRARGAGGRLLRPDAGGAGGAGAGHFRRFGAIRERVLVDLWAGYPGTQSVNFGRTVSADAEMRLRMDPEVVAVEPYQWVDGDWTPERVDAGSVSIYLSGIAVGPDAMLFSKLLPPDLRKRLREPGR